MTATGSPVLAGARYLVTGAAGFIGSHLCERLLTDGVQVLGVDSLLTGSVRNLKPLFMHPTFEFIEHDITVPRAWDGGFAGVFHLACPASPVDYARLPLETLAVGSAGTWQMCELALRVPCPLLLASTSEVYGDPLVHPQPESYWGNVNPIGPRSCYDEAKRFSESLVMNMHRVRGLKSRIVRIFNTYGPRMRSDDGRVVPNFCMQALQGQSITVYGEGSQTRSFCFVSDLVDGLVRALHQDYSLPINLGNPSEITIAEFANVVSQLAGVELRVEHRDLPEDDPKTRQPDISTARRVLGWEPKVTLTDGLRQTLAYFDEVMKAQGNAAPQTSFDPLNQSL